MAYEIFSGSMNFQRVAGARQLQIKEKEDLENILKLDEAHWALTSIPVGVVCANPVFLDFLDLDHNGIIRTDELQDAVRFLLESCKDVSGALKGSDTLELCALNEDSKRGAGMKAAAELILAGLKAEKDDRITLEQAQGKSQVLTISPVNGDGVIPLSAVSDERAKKLHSVIMAMEGSCKDVSGEDGISLVEIDAFQAHIEKTAAWRNAAEANLVFGSQTAEIAAETEALAGAVDDFFLACETVSYYENDETRIGKNSFTVDIQNPEEYRAMLEKSTIAQPGKNASLDTNCLPGGSAAWLPEKNLPLSSRMVF